MNIKLNVFLVIIALFCILLLKADLAIAYSFENTNEFLNNTAEQVGYEKEQGDFYVIMASIIKVVLSIVGALFLVLIIFSGFKWMTSGGNPDRIKSAQKTMFMAIIGLLIILTAYSITYFIASRLGGGGEEGAGGPTTCRGSGGLCNPSCGGYAGTRSIGQLDCPQLDPTRPNCCVSGE